MKRNCLFLFCILGIVYATYSQTEIKDNSKKESWDGVNTKCAIKYMKVDKTTVLQTDEFDYEAGGFENEDGSKSTYLIIKKPIQENEIITLESDGDKIDVKVFPNPMDRTTTFHFINFETNAIRLYIYDYKGNTVLNVEDVTKEEYIFNKGNLNSGNYIYKVTFNGEIVKTGNLIIN